MKTYITLLALLCLIIFIFGSCATSITYTTGLFSDMCIEFTTDDEEIQNDAEAEGLEEGTCPSGYVGDVCEFSAPYNEGGDDVDVAVYFYAPTFDATTAALACDEVQAGF